MPWYTAFLLQDIGKTPLTRRLRVITQEIIIILTGFTDIVNMGSLKALKSLNELDSARLSVELIDSRTTECISKLFLQLCFNQC